MQAQRDVQKMWKSVHEPHQPLPVHLPGELPLHQHPLPGGLPQGLPQEVWGEVYPHQWHLLHLGQGCQWSEEG